MLEIATGLFLILWMSPIIIFVAIVLFFIVEAIAHMFD